MDDWLKLNGLHYPFDDIRIHASAMEHNEVFHKLIVLYSIVPDHISEHNGRTYFEELISSYPKLFGN